MNRFIIAGSLGIAVFLAGLSISGSWTGWKAKATIGTITELPAETSNPDAEWVPPEPPLGGPVPASLLPASRQPRIDRMMQFNHRTLSEAYDKVGNKSPAWDEHAHVAMEAAALFFSGVQDPPAKAKDVHAATQKALDAGCNDPLILNLHVRSADPQTPAAELERGYMKAGDAMKASAICPAFRRAAPMGRAAELKLKRKDDPKARAEALALLSASLTLVAVSARDDGRGLDIEDIWYRDADETLQGLRKLGMEPLEALKYVEKRLAPEKPLEATRLLLRGEYLIKSAWEARGSGYANTVTQDRWRLFDQRITAARAALEQSWALAPENGRAAYHMLTIERAQSRGRAAMEMWFERAIMANPTRKVCGQKLDWLHPKWHGSTQEMLIFGRQCRDSKNWESGLPLLVVQTHRLIADMLADDAAKSNYYRRPDVAGDILYAYAGCLKRNPDDHVLRSSYAYYLFTCGRPAESHRQFQRLGENLRWDELYTEPLMKQTRAKAAAQAGS